MNTTRIKFIIGMAGTGKSTRLAKMANGTDCIITPTHKAARVLRTKGIQNVVTIHSLLKLIPSMNESAGLKDKDNILTQVGDVDLTKIDRVFLDEFSMVSYDIFELLLKHLPDIQLIVMGDAAQLPPVDGVEIDPLDYVSTEDDIEILKTQYRAEAPGVVKLFTKYHDAVVNEQYIEPTIIPNGVDIIDGNLDSFNPKTDTILAYTNKKVLALNAKVAANLGQSSFEVGSTININNLTGTITAIPSSNQANLFPSMISKGTFIDSSKLQDILESHRKFNATTHFDYPTLDISIDGIIYTIHYNTNHYEDSNIFSLEAKALNDFIKNKWTETSKMTARDFKVWCRDNKNTHTKVRDRQKSWQVFMGHRADVFDARWPYATTVHKAQGSEFSKVFIAHKNIKTSMRNRQFKTYNRLMYVALSRAINKIIII